MERTLSLKFVDGSSKECEVTGREMGGSNVYIKPLSSLKKGRIDWGDNRHADHSVHVLEKGEDYVVVKVKNFIGHEVGGPYELYAGVKKGCSYMFGEWSYSFYVSLEWL